MHTVYNKKNYKVFKNETKVSCKGCSFARLSKDGYGCTCPDDFPIEHCDEKEIFKVVSTA